MREAKRLKASGYKRGFPDVFVYEPRGEVARPCHRTEKGKRWARQRLTT